jgi:Esterase-like activity of phytase
MFTCWGEGLVVERGDRTILATSEREPSIRRFRLSDGPEIASLPVPARFQVAPAGEATSNATFESLAVSGDGRSLFAGMGVRSRPMARTPTAAPATASSGMPVCRATLTSRSRSTPTSRTLGSRCSSSPG